MADTEGTPMHLPGPNVLFCLICLTDIGYEADITQREALLLPQPCFQSRRMFHFDLGDTCLEEFLDQVRVKMYCSCCSVFLGYKVISAMGRRIEEFIVLARYLLLRDGTGEYLDVRTRARTFENWRIARDRLSLLYENVYHCLRCGMEHAQEEDFIEWTYSRPIAVFRMITNVHRVSLELTVLNNGTLRARHQSINCDGCKAKLGSVIETFGPNGDNAILVDVGTMLLVRVGDDLIDALRQGDYDPARDELTLRRD